MDGNKVTGSHGKSQFCKWKKSQVKKSQKQSQEIMSQDDFIQTVLLPGNVHN